jgi:hypothetical protein
VRAFLQKPGLIHDSDACGMAPGLFHQHLQDIPRRIGIPLVLVQQPLRPIRRLVAHGLGQLPPILALHLRQHSSQMLGALLTGLATMKHGGKPRVKGGKVISPFAQFFWFHDPPSA